MIHENQKGRVVMTPDSLTGVTTMTNSQPLTSTNSISEIEYAVRLGIGVRHMFDLRKEGKLPPHFLATKPGSAKKQIRYSLADIEAHERTKQKTELQT
jgi:hypothetical protein